MQQLFIADLHLSPEHPRLVRGFLDLLMHYQGKVNALYILGDWFDAWIGDDDTSPWLDHIVTALQQFVSCGSQVFFIHGNRDFALGQAFMDRFGGQLLTQEPVILPYPTGDIVIEHGDALCTDDIQYQKFRKIIRHPVLLKTLLWLPLPLRRQIASYARQKSKSHTQQKSSYIMDVNEYAVQQRLVCHNILLHGHTHRPAIHNYQNGKKRYVLGDWRENNTFGQGEAMIALFNEHDGLQLICWNF